MAINAPQFRISPIQEALLPQEDARGGPFEGFLDRILSTALMQKGQPSPEIPESTADPYFHLPGLMF